MIISHIMLTPCLLILWTFLCSFTGLDIPFSLEECVTSLNTPYSYVKTKSVFSFLFFNTSHKKKLPKRAQDGKGEPNTVRDFQSCNSPSNICHGLKNPLCNTAVRTWKVRVVANHLEIKWIIPGREEAGAKKTWLYLSCQWGSLRCG